MPCSAILNSMRIVFALVVVFMAVGAGQDRPIAGSTRFYEAVVDRLFDVPARLSRNEVLWRVCRGDKPELQLVFSRPVIGETEASVWHLAPDAQPVHRQIEALASNKPAVTVEEATAAIAVRKARIRVPATDSLVRTLQKLDSLSVPVSMVDVLSLHTPAFTLRMDMGSRFLEVRSVGPDRIPPAIDPIYAWMEDVDSTLRSFLATQNPTAR